MSANSSPKRALRSVELRIGEWPGCPPATGRASWWQPCFAKAAPALRLLPKSAPGSAESRDGNRVVGGSVFSREPSRACSMAWWSPAANPRCKWRCRTRSAQFASWASHWIAYRGPCPARLSAVLPLVDWIGFDIKAAFDDYVRITGTTGSGIKAKASLLRVLQSGVACDFRTTVHDALLIRFDLARLASELAALRVHEHRLQPFRVAGCTNVNLL